MEIGYIYYNQRVIKRPKDNNDRCDDDMYCYEIDMEYWQIVEITDTIVWYARIGCEVINERETIFCGRIQIFREVRPLPNVFMPKGKNNIYIRMMTENIKLH